MAIATDISKEVLISADSHVSEDGEMWKKMLPAKYRDNAPVFPGRQQRVGEGRFDEKTGGYDPNERLKEMATDGVSAEVLYPTLGLRLFGMDDAELQEACFRVYNDWLLEYCSVALDRLLGVSCISAYDAEHAVAEMERTRKAGMVSAMIWQAPHPDLPFHSSHYDKIWAASQDLDMPISLHILTGHNYSKNGLGAQGGRSGVEHYRGSVNLKTIDAMNAFFDLIFYGVLDRYPKLRIVNVENEIGWIPFFLQQWDYYYRRFHESNPPPIDETPSTYFYRQIYVTFFDDHVGGQNLSWWGQDNAMWSNDYPHPNSTWPHSREVIARDLGHLPADVRKKLVCDNVARLFNLKVPAPVA
jgi:predicted TIM-barrel fold metal-dependent hydrolase